MIRIAARSVRPARFTMFIMFTMFTVVWSASARAPRCGSFRFSASLGIPCAPAMIPPYSSALKGAVLKTHKIVPRLDFSSRAISVRCSLAAYSLYDSNVSRRNPVWICFGGLLPPRFRHRLADDLENSQCDLSVILRQPSTNYFERRVLQFHPTPTPGISRIHWNASIF